MHPKDVFAFPLARAARVFQLISVASYTQDVPTPPSGRTTSCTPSGGRARRMGRVPGRSSSAFMSSSRTSRARCAQAHCRLRFGFRARVPARRFCVSLAHPPISPSWSGCTVLLARSLSHLTPCRCRTRSRRAQGARQGYARPSERRGRRAAFKSAAVERVVERKRGPGRQRPDVLDRG